MGTASMAQGKCGVGGVYLFVSLGLVLGWGFFGWVFLFGFVCLKKKQKTKH